MKLIVGLGNPGDKYQLTRHNVGFWLMDRLVESSEFGVRRKEKKSVLFSVTELTLRHSSGQATQNSELVISKPQTFMNDSGLAVRKICQKYKVDLQNLLVVHDDLDLSLGEFKLQFGKGPKAHNGVLSVEVALKTKEFWRLRVGVESRIKNEELRIKGEEYVLSKFTKDEVEKLEEIVTRIRRSVEKWIES